MVDAGCRHEEEENRHASLVLGGWGNDSPLNSTLSTDGQTARTQSYGTRRVPRIKFGRSGAPSGEVVSESHDRSILLMPVAAALTNARQRWESEPVGSHDEDDVENPVAVEDESSEALEDSSANDESPEHHTPFSRSLRPSLADLEEQRELARRRSSFCTLLAVFILFKLWIEALVNGDFGLLMLCLVASSWTARFINYQREREAELDARINQYNEASESEQTPNDLRMLSFQAQLALAIMESQRQMMQGGYGHPDGNGDTPGVSDERKSQWKTVNFKATDYPDVKKSEEPHCSICLSEYEDGEALTQLPCNHVYHEECIHSWTANHTKCPLCNYELEEAQEAV